ncbi:MAG: sigma-70 family RNA polymerase sigma factor, partial [Actinomadura rubrobrunea]|nr:sigma-70 family RNA polymerase sigma factor [Actinomadura rubrobrunea]
MVLPGQGDRLDGLGEVSVSDAASPDPSAEESSDAALISRVRAGDVSAYATLHERHAAAARTLARHLTVAGAAEDVVQEAFAKVLDVLRRGGGPRAEFRPYLLTAVRRAVDDRRRGERRPRSTDRSEVDDPGAPFADPALEELERSTVARAFRSLPERWRTVLWHTEVEGAQPAEVAPLLGLTPDGATALAYRAREGLREAYLRLHLPAEGADASPSGAGAAASRPDEECRAVLGKLGAHVRGGLSRRESRAVRRHLDGCERCAAVAAELTAVGSALREVIGALVLGAAATAYTGAAQRGGAFGGVFGFPPRPTRRQQVLGGAAAALAAAVVLGLILVSADESIPPPHEPPGVPHRPAPSPTPRADLPASEAAPSSQVTAPGGGVPRAVSAGSAPRPSPAPNPPAVQPRPPKARLVTRIGVVGARGRGAPRQGGRGGG